MRVCGAGNTCSGRGGGENEGAWGWSGGGVRVYGVGTNCSSPLHGCMLYFMCRFIGGQRHAPDGDI